MKKTILVKSFLGMCLVLGALNYAFAEDAEVKLNSNDGTTKMIVQDKDAKTVASFDSAGNLVVTGTATVAGSKFSVGGSTLVVSDGNVSIGTAVPQGRFYVRAAGANAIVVSSSSGNVGIWVTSPTTTLQIGNDWGNMAGKGALLGVAGVNPTIYIDETGYPSPDYGAIVFGGSGLDKAKIDVGLSSVPEDIRFFTHRDFVNPVMTIGDGKVGIGTTSPAVTLDVGGTDAIKVPVGTTAQRPASPANGMLRVNTDTGRLEYYKDQWIGIGAVTATGGTVTDVGGYRVHTFTASGTFTVNISGNIEVLVVAGGGGGSSSDGGISGGGGGAGGLIYNASYGVNIGAISVTVGSGGNGGAPNSDNGTNGNNSVFATLTAIGGGKGAYSLGGGPGIAGANGGSGGGGGLFGGGPTSGGSGTSGQGYAGGSGYGGPYNAGGGGGAGATGENATSGGGGAGGVGLAYSISGSSVYYAGGGGGGSYSGYSPGAGGTGGGGAGAQCGGGTSATPNTGGGGGGGGCGAPAGNGGSGIVIIRYPE